MRLSRLQKSILTVIGRHTIDISDERDICCPDCERLYRIWWFRTMTNRELYEAVCQEHLVSRSSFSRSLHNLLEVKDLIYAYALAWEMVYKHGNRIKHDWVWWQGGGPREKTKYVSRWSGQEETSYPPQPRYSFVALTTAGWDLVRLDDPDAGKCPHVLGGMNHG